MQTECNAALTDQDRLWQGHAAQEKSQAATEAEASPEPVRRQADSGSVLREVSTKLLGYVVNLWG